MTELRKAAERALDALEDIFGKEKKDVGAINALRQALAQNDLEEAVAKGTKAWADVPDASKWVEQLRGNVDKVNISEERVHKTEKSIHEPVAFVNGYFGGYLTITCFDSTLVLPDGLALYAAPPKKEWVGLTDEEVDALLGKLSLGAVDEDVRTIEAKLKEKNHANNT